MPATPLSRSISDKFRFWSFLSITGIVFLHSYNLQQRFLQPWTTVGEKLTPTSFTEYFMANGLLRILIPMLFAISGFLYALRDPASINPQPDGSLQPNGNQQRDSSPQPNGSQRLKKRLRTLLVPYLAWSTFAITATWCMELFPCTRQLVATSGIAYLDHHRRLLHDYKAYELIRSWLFSTLAYQLWFLRVLLIYNLAYPVLRWCILHKIVKWLFWGAAILLWLGSFESPFVEGEGLLFFSLGIWIQKANVNIETSDRQQKRARWWTLLFLSSAAVNTWLAFKGQTILGNRVFPIIILLHKLTIASGLIACWFGLDGLARYAMGHKGFAGLTAFAFFIYVFHTPLVGYAINPMLAWLDPLPAFHLLAFILLPLMVIGLSMGIGAIGKKIAPAAYRLLTGGRGI